MQFIFIIVLLLSNIVYSIQYLTNNQWTKINNIIMNIDIDIDTSNNIRNNINNLLFISYEKWAINKAYEFKKYHYNKCKSISIDELSIYSSQGLMMGIQKYKGNSSFTNYVNFYINGCLYRGLTNLHTLTLIPKSHRMKKRNLNEKYKRILHTKFIGNDEWMIENKQNYEPIIDKIINNEYYCNIWEWVDNNLDNKSKQILKYKYDYYFNKIRSNKEISILMVYSEEYIRKKHSEILIKMSLILQSYNY